MSLPGVHGFDFSLLHYIFEPAARSLALAGAVWLLLAAFRVRDVGFRLAAWTAVLYAALAMPFLGQTMPGLPVLLPAVGTTHTSSSTQQPMAAVAGEINRVAAMQEAAATYTAPPADRTTGLAASERPEPAVLNAPALTAALAVNTNTAPAPVSVTPAARPALPAKVSISWMTLAAVLYGLIATALIVRLSLGLALSRRIERAATPIEDERLRRLFERAAAKVGLSKTPGLVESAALSIPAAMGLWRPVVLLPRGWEDWSDAQIEAVLAHELSHVARRDPLTQSLANLHRAVFWFSPLAWWLDRTLVELAEQASDDAALRAGADRTRYAEVLLHFFRALRMARGRVRWQAVAMAQGSRSARRVERILSGSSTSIRLGRAAVAAVAIGLIPLACLAAAVEPSFSAQMQLPAPPPPLAPPAPPVGALAKTLVPPPIVVPTPMPAPKVPNAPKAPAFRPPEPAATLPPPTAAPFLLAVPAPFTGPAFTLAVPAPPARRIWFTREMPPETIGNQSVRRENWYASQDCRGNEAYIVVSGDRTMSECASPADMAKVSALRRKIPGNFLWFRKNGRSYVIRDAATVNAAIQAFAAQRDLARQQAELASKQALLGAKQAALGMQQARARVEMPDFSVELKQMQATLREMRSSDLQRVIERAQAQMAAAFKALDSSAAQEQLGLAQERLAKTLQSLDASITERTMARVAAQMAEMRNKLGTLQSVAGKEQAALGARQAELGQKEAELGRRQEKLARRQEELARKTADQVRHLIDRALKSGLAQPQ